VVERRRHHHDRRHRRPGHRPPPWCHPWVAALPVLALLLASCALAAGWRRAPLPTTITVGPKRELLIRGTVDHTPVVLKLDTGSSTTALTPAACRRLGIGGRRYSAGAPPLGAGAGGSIDDVRWVFLRKLRFASELLWTHPAVVIDLEAANGAIDGLLGMDVLGLYALDVDLRAHRFVLHREGEVRHHTADLVAIDYRPLRGGQIALAITVAGRPATAILDLGANRTLANRRVALPHDDDTVVSAAIGADRRRLSFHTASNVELGVGGLVLRAGSVWVNDLPIFRTFALHDRPAVVLGIDVLADRRIVIDPFERRIYLSR
jgi:Aspartyl protease